MPAKAPAVDEVLQARLKRLGAGIRAQRRTQKVSATTAAEAAGMARVTLHRIERGEPSVTMGAYLTAIAAVGLQLELSGGRGTADAAAQTNAPRSVPPRIRLAEYPQLQRLAWHMKGAADISPQEALSLYERNWRHIDQSELGASERGLLQALVADLGGGRMLI